MDRLAELSPPAMIAHIAALCAVLITAGAIVAGVARKAMIPTVYLVCYGAYSITGTAGFFPAIFWMMWFRDEMIDLFTRSERVDGGAVLVRAPRARARA